jgi:hypothetical protein
MLTYPKIPANNLMKFEIKENMLLTIYFKYIELREPTEHTRSTLSPCFMQSLEIAKFSN